MIRTGFRPRAIGISCDSDDLRESPVPHVSELSLYREALLFLVTAGVVAPLFVRLRISPVLGYVLAGAALGPDGLGRLAGRAPWLDSVMLRDVASISRLAEFGVVTLMFTIGLELSFERLKSLRRLVFGLGPAQLVLSTALIGAAAAFAGEAPAAALVIGAALSLSSTAMVVPALAEAKLQRTPLGRFAFAVLLFQDLAVAPLLFVATMLSSGTGDHFAWRLALILAPAALAVGAVILIGRLALRPLFRSVALTRSPEFFMAACLLVVLGAALIAASSGLSMALGAFLAGLLLAETEYRREIEVTIEPFKGLLLGLFFVSIGAELDLTLAAAEPVAVFGTLAAFVALKTVSFYPIARLFGANPATARDVSLALGPGGEFAFVLVGVALAGGLVEPQTGRIVMLAAALSMLATPFLGRTLGALATRRRARNLPAEARIDPAGGHRSSGHHRRLWPRRAAHRRYAGGPQDPLHSRRFRRQPRRRGAARQQARLFRRRHARRIPAQLRYRDRPSARGDHGCAGGQRGGRADGARTKAGNHARRARPRRRTCAYALQPGRH